MGDLPLTDGGLDSSLSSTWHTPDALLGKGVLILIYLDYYGILLFSIITAPTMHFIYVLHTLHSPLFHPYSQLGLKITLHGLESLDMISLHDGDSFFQLVLSSSITI